MYCRGRILLFWPDVFPRFALQIYFFAGLCSSCKSLMSSTYSHSSLIIIIIALFSTSTPVLVSTRVLPLHYFPNGHPYYSYVSKHFVYQTYNYRLFGFHFAFILLIRDVWPFSANISPLWSSRNMSSSSIKSSNIKIFGSYIRYNIQHLHENLQHPWSPSISIVPSIEPNWTCGSLTEALKVARASNDDICGLAKITGASGIFVEQRISLLGLHIPMQWFSSPFWSAKTCSEPPLLWLVPYSADQVGPRY